MSSGVLLSEHLASWYVLQDSDSVLYLFENWAEKQTQKADKVELLQGDIGTRVMNIGEASFGYTISSPVVIIQQPGNVDSPTNRVVSALDLLAAICGGVIPFPYNNDNIPEYFLNSASLSLTEDVNVKLDITAAAEGVFQPVFAPSVQDWQARKAKWFDTQLVFDTPWMNTAGFNVKKFDLTFKIKVDKEVFIGSGQVPYYAYQGYEVSGSITILIPPPLVDTFRTSFMPLQSPGLLVGTTWQDTLSLSETPPQQIWIRVGDEANGTQIGLGRTFVATQLERDLKPGQATYATITFNNFVNSSSYMSTSHPINTPFG